jgi:hypothetical protein
MSPADQYEATFRDEEDRQAFGDANGLRSRPDPNPLRLALSKPTFPELLFGALRVADVSGGFLVRPALLPRFAEAASGRLARLNSSLGELGFHGCPGCCGLVAAWLRRFGSRLLEWQRRWIREPAAALGRMVWQSRGHHCRPGSGRGPVGPCEQRKGPLLNNMMPDRSTTPT